MNNRATLEEMEGGIFASVMPDTAKEDLEENSVNTAYMLDATSHVSGLTAQTEKTTNSTRHRLKEAQEDREKLEDQNELLAEQNKQLLEIQRKQKDDLDEMRILTENYARMTSGGHGIEEYKEAPSEEEDPPNISEKQANTDEKEAETHNTTEPITQDEEDTRVTDQLPPMPTAQIEQEPQALVDSNTEEIEKNPDNLMTVTPCRSLTPSKGRTAPHNARPSRQQQKNSRGPSAAMSAGKG